MDNIITIDGPAGSGKTTVSKILAERLGYRYIDTGALYRGVALEVILQNVDPEDDIALEKLCLSLDLQPILQKDEMRLISNGRDITGEIRTAKVTMMASTVSARPVVRTFLLSLQKKFGEEKKAIFEGRDMGTVVFPDADIKFFLMASPEQRAARRFAEMPQDSGQKISDVARDMKIRDKKDSSRKIAPLKPANDALIIDSTSLTLEQVVDKMMVNILYKSS